MKVHGPANESELEERARTETRQIFDKAADGGRVCGAQCQAACPVCGKADCRCACTSKCPDMPAMMTSDPRAPLEDGIAPLAFELKKLGCFEPCWSCEGHLNPQGEPWKIPQVWFYADNMTSIRALTDVIAELFSERVTGVPWEVALTYTASDTLSPTFALRPKGTVETAGPLPSLRTDVLAISDQLHARYLARVNALKLRADRAS